MQILEWFKKAYFFELSPKNHITIAFKIGLFIFIFLYIFKPFGMEELEGNLFIYSLGFGCVTFLVQSFFYTLLPLIFKDFFKEDRFTIRKNIFFLIVLVSCISICNWLYNSQFQNIENWRLLTFQEIFTYTFSISIFPIFLVTYFSEKKYRKKREKVSENIMLNKVSLEHLKINEEIKILGENKKDNVVFNVDNLVYATTQGNYVSFYITTENGLKEKIVRNTLTNINNSLKKYSTFIRCHKSYIINSKFMNTISGNARGYYLESDLLTIQIPISRSFKKEELKNLIS